MKWLDVRLENDWEVTEIRNFFTGIRGFKIAILGIFTRIRLFHRLILTEKAAFTGRLSISEQRYNINVLKARNVKYRIESLFVYYMQKDLNIINYSYWKKYQYLCSSSSSSRRVMLLRSMACQA